MFLILRSTACSPVVGLMAVSGLLAFEAGDEAAGARNADVDGDATPEAPPFVAAAGRVNDIAAMRKSGREAWPERRRHFVTLPTVSFRLILTYRAT
jgi:hypothetical protein